MSPKFVEESNGDALERSLKNADWLRAVDSAAVAEARRLAQILDDPDFPTIGGRFDNVSPARYLDVLNSLKLTPAARDRAEREAAKLQTKKEPRVRNAVPPGVSVIDAQRAKYRRG